MPTMPLHTSITAANTVSRASPAFSGPLDNITETISATSMTVTATASTSVPNGSPMRCATTSAWWTAANTVATSAKASIAATKPAAPAMALTAIMSHAMSGQTQVHHGVAGFFAATLFRLRPEPHAEPLEVDHHALVGAAPDLLDLVARADVEPYAAVFDARHRRARGHLMADRRRCEMANVDCGADGAFARVEK